MEFFPNTENPSAAGDKAEQMIASEVAIQNVMWGDANERADISRGQLLQAAMAQIRSIDMVAHNGLEMSRDAIFDHCKALYYPADWSGFRDYGSDIANLVVAAAYLQQEIKRRLVRGESCERASRRKDEPYTRGEPHLSAEAAQAHLDETAPRVTSDPSLAPA